MKNFTVSHKTFCRILRRILLVAGFVTYTRICAVRIGALATYDDTLRPSLANFVASHDEKMLQNNYQAGRIRVNLAEKQFGAPLGGKDVEPLFDVMRDLSKQNNPGASIEPTAEQNRSIEDRHAIVERKKNPELTTKSGDGKMIAQAKNPRPLATTSLRPVGQKGTAGIFCKSENTRAPGQQNTFGETCTRPMAVAIMLRWTLVV